MMASRTLLYYITDRHVFPGIESERRIRLLEKISEAANTGVDYIQLREKDLPSRELESLARAAIETIRKAQPLRTGNRQPITALLINSRTDIALAVGADGIHLRANDISPNDVKQIYQCGAGAPAREISPQNPLIGVSCHSPEEVAQAATQGATFAVFGPVFEKKDAPGTTPAGLNQLRKASRAKIPILALGGVTLENAHSCLEAGAAGIAAIRLFQENKIADVVRLFRKTS